MSYLGGSYLSGDAATAETVADQALSTAYSPTQTKNFKAAYAKVASMSSAQRTALLAVLTRRLKRLPARQKQLVREIAVQTAASDPRTATGLGSVGVASTIANIASITATLGTLGLQTWDFLERKKEAERQQSAQAQQSAAEAALIQSQIETNRQRLEMEKKKQEAELAAFLSQSGQAIDPTTGAVIKAPSQPGTKTVPILLGGGLALLAAFVAK